MSRIISICLQILGIYLSGNLKTLDKNNTKISYLLLGKPLRNTSAVQMEFCQIAFQPPRPQENGRFVGTIFAENQLFF